MSDTKFTPGPWVCGNRYSLSGVYTESGDVIANTHGSHRNFDRDSQLAEQDANAHLISAAPELYESLRGLMMHFLADENGQLPPNLYDSPFYNECLRELYPRAIATLAKARGES